MTWDCLNFDNGTITIDKAFMRVEKYSYVDGKLQMKRVNEMTDLKSKSSYRTLGLPAEYLELLKEHLERQKELAKSKGKVWCEQDFIFTSVSYKGYLADYTSDKFRIIMDELKVRDYKELTPHCLRHTFCSRRNSCRRKFK